MATADKFVQRSGDPSTTIDKDDIGVSMHVYRFEINAFWPAFRLYFTGTGENVGAGLPTGSICPFASVLINEEGDDRIFTEAGMGGPRYQESGGYLFPPSAWTYEVDYDSDVDLWVLTCSQTSTSTRAAGYERIGIDVSSKRIIWVTLIHT